jgi:hypothetical protein
MSRHSGRYLSAVFIGCLLFAAFWLVRGRAVLPVSSAPTVEIGMHLGEVPVIPRRAPMENLAAQFVETALTDPQSRRNYDGFLKAHPRDAQKALGELAIAGLKRLDDRTMARRGQIALHLLDLADESTCAGFMGDRPIALGPLLEKLPEDQRQNWVGISVKATFLELNQTGYPAIAKEEMDAVYPKIFASADPQEKNFLHAFFDRTASEKLPDTVHCRAIKALYAGASRLGARERAIALKTFSGSIP